MFNTKGSEQVAVLGVAAPASQGAGAATTAYVNAKNFDQIMVIVSAGALGTAATLDAKLVQATAVGGTGSKDVTGKAITQLTKAGTDDNKQAIINLRTAELDITGGFFWVAVTVTVAEAASLVSVVILGVGPRYGPASLNDVATVDSIA